MFLYDKNGKKYNFDYPIDASEALSRKDENGNQIYFSSEKEFKISDSETIARLTSKDNVDKDEAVEENVEDNEESEKSLDDNVETKDEAVEENVE